jgi:hypothetical protein
MDGKTATHARVVIIIIIIHFSEFQTVHEIQLVMAVLSRLCNHLG